MIAGEGMSYSDALTAISNGSVDAQGIEQICNQWGVTSEQLYTDLYGNDNLQFFKTSDGGTTVIKGVNTTQYTGYYGNASTSGAQSSVDISHEINSNTSGVTTKTATKITTPVNTSINAQTGKIQMDTELTHIGGQSITDGKLSMGTIATATMAAGVGIGLGKTVDSLLYQSNPDFWDAHNMSSLNPETWGSITEGIDENDPWYTRLGATAFNAIFVTDKNTGVTKMMLPEDAIAYAAAYMQQQGAFDKTHMEYEVDDPTAGNYSLLKTPIYPVTSFNANWALTGETGRPLHYVDIVSQTSPVYYVLSYNDGTYIWDMYSKDPFSGRQNINGESSWIRPFEGVETSFNGETFYHATTSFINTYYNWGTDVAIISQQLNPYVSSNNGLSELITPNNSNAGTALGYILLFQSTVTEDYIPGLDDQDNATLPNFSGISDITDISEVLAALKQQYPDIFDDSEGILQESVLEDGTSIQTKYYPIPIPTPNPNNANQPTGGQGTDSNPTTQLNPSVDPDTSGDTFLQTLTKYILTQPTIPGVDTTNPPDTGNGKTPAVVVPDGSASALFAVYNPTQAQVDSFGAWLWSSSFVDQILKMFNDPMEAIISLHKIFATPSTGSAQDIYVGYLDSGVSAATVTDQYTSVDCGTVSLDEYFGNILDYTATQIELYLPFVGIVSLNVDEVMRGKVHIIYHVDVLTGACLVDVEVTRDMAGGTLYQYSGDCAVHYPLSSGSYMGIVGGLLSVAAGVGGSIATGGAALPVLMGAGAAAMSAHTDVARSGGFSANSGAMGIKKPYFIINRPQTAIAEYYLQLEGIGSNQNTLLSDCSGYVKIKDVQLAGINAYGSELSEIESLLKGGVLI